MKTSRLEKLLEFYQEDPNDPFNSYALALEYQKNDTSQAEAAFEQLLAKFPDYLPSYYTAAQFFVSQDQNLRAEEIFKTGIQLAQFQQNTKAYQELVRAYRAFQDEQMDW
ncbi:MAG: tetratricopeptide repeat protein [Bacteroidetes bacterium]|nr:tetratricopeptide repeat protein [Bacteroidota bacterium]